MLNDQKMYQDRLMEQPHYRCKAYSPLEAQSIRYGHRYVVIRIMLCNGLS